jgi:hypothetical protein
MPSTSIDPAPKKLQEIIQQDFPVVPTNRRGANRFNRGYFQKITRNTRGKRYEKTLTTSDPIQVSSDIEIPQKRLRKVSAEELKPHRKTKSEHTSPHKPFVCWAHDLVKLMMMIRSFLTGIICVFYYFEEVLKDSYIKSS